MFSRGHSHSRSPALCRPLLVPGGLFQGTPRPTVISHDLSVSDAAKQPPAGPLQPYRPPPLRPGYGTRGRPIPLKVNLFPVRFPRGELYHYDVTITPNCPKRICRVVFEALMKKYAKDFIGRQRPVFDGSKNMYCRQELPIPEKEVYMYCGKFRLL